MLPLPQPPPQPLREPDHCFVRRVQVAHRHATPLHTTPVVIRPLPRIVTRRPATMYFLRWRGQRSSPRIAPRVDATRTTAAAAAAADGTNTLLPRQKNPAVATARVPTALRPRRHVRRGVAGGNASRSTTEAPAAPPMWLVAVRHAHRRCSPNCCRFSPLHHRRWRVTQTAAGQIHAGQPPFWRRQGIAPQGKDNVASPRPRPRPCPITAGSWRRADPWAMSVVLRPRPHTFPPPTVSCPPRHRQRRLRAQARLRSHATGPSQTGLSSLLLREMAATQTHPSLGGPVAVAVGDATLLPTTHLVYTGARAQKTGPVVRHAGRSAVFRPFFLVRNNHSPDHRRHLRVCVLLLTVPTNSNLVVRQPGSLSQQPVSRQPPPP